MRTITIIIFTLSITGCLHEPSEHPIVTDANDRFHTETVGCDTFAGLPDIVPESVADTPRVNDVAEEVALFASGELIAPEELYHRVVDDLEGIHASFPGFTDVRPIRCYVPNSLIIRFDTETFEQVRSWNYDAWDELNGVLRASVNNIHDSFGWVSLAFVGRYNGPRIGAEYSALPGVESASMSGRGWAGFPSRMCMAQRDFYNFYILTKGGERMADVRTLAVGVAHSGEIVSVGEWNGFSDGIPAWFSNAEDCRALY